MRGLTPRERELLAEAQEAMRYGAGLHLDRQGDRVVAGRLERRGAFLCSPCGGEGHYTVTALGADILRLDTLAKAPPPSGCF